MQILITGHHNFHNKGCEALVFTTTELLRNAFPGAHFTAVSMDPHYDNKHFNNGSVQCNFIKYGFQINEFSIRNRLWFFLRYYIGVTTDRILWMNRVLYEAIKASDLLVVSGGDILADYGEAGIKHAFFPVAVAIAIKKPVYILAQSFSPYENRRLLSFAKYYLNKVQLITVRERRSLSYLKEIGIKAPLHLTADTAFLLSQCSDQRLSEILKIEGLSGINKPLIGVSVSKTLTRWTKSSHEEFMRIIADACDNLIEKYGAHVVFVSHVTDTNPKNNDLFVAEAVKELMKKQGSATVIQNEYSCSELKAVIGRCALFIGARTHATIASSSQGIPTIALAYSTKAFGIMEDVLDANRCVCDIRNLTKNDLLSKAEYFLENASEASSAITARLQAIKDRAMLNGSLAKELLIS